MIRKYNISVKKKYKKSVNVKYQLEGKIVAATLLLTNQIQKGI